MFAGWLRQKLINPIACRLSSAQQPSVPDTAFSVTQTLKAPKSILIVSDSRAGALFLAASQFWAIRNCYPNAHICLLARNDREFIAREIPFVNQVIIYHDFLLPFGTQMRETVKQLQTQPFDLAFCFSSEPNFCPAYLCFKSGARIRIGFQREDLPFFNVRIVPRTEEYYEEQRLSLLLHTLGIPQVKERVSWSVSKESAQKIQQRFLVGRKTSETFVALDVSSSNGERPSAKQFLEIAQATAKNVRLLVFFNFPERKIAHHIREHLGQQVLIFETDDLPKIVALLETCHHLIACNSDLFHLGVSMGLSVKGIFSAADIPKWAPSQSSKNVEIFDVEQLKTWIHQHLNHADHTAKTAS